MDAAIIQIPVLDKETSVALVVAQKPVVVAPPATVEPVVIDVIAVPPAVLSLYPLAPSSLHLYLCTRVCVYACVHVHACAHTPIAITFFKSK